MQRSPPGSAASNRQVEKKKVGERRVEPAKQAALRDEFLIAMDKFSAGIHRTIQQIEGEVTHNAKHHQYAVDSHLQSAITRKYELSMIAK